LPSSSKKRVVLSHIVPAAAARATSSQSTLRPVTQNLQCPQDGVKVRITFSPIRDFGTPGPTDSMIPQASWPRITGFGCTQTSRR
jgi:hypothetical protein